MNLRPTRHRLMSLADIKARLRDGQWAWPGGYPCYFITADGEAMSFAAVRSEWREIVGAHLTFSGHVTGWEIAGCDINWEDPELYCAHTNERIQSAYAEDDAPCS